MKLSGSLLLVVAGAVLAVAIVVIRPTPSNVSTPAPSTPGGATANVVDSGASAPSAAEQSVAALIDFLSKQPEVREAQLTGRCTLRIAMVSAKGEGRTYDVSLANKTRMPTSRLSGATYEVNLGSGGMDTFKYDNGAMGSMTTGVNIRADNAQAASTLTDLATRAVTDCRPSAVGAVYDRALFRLTTKNARS